MKYFRGCNEAAKWGEWMTSSRPGHGLRIRQPISGHICTGSGALMVWWSWRWIWRPRMAVYDLAAEEKEPNLLEHPAYFKFKWLVSLKGDIVDIMSPLDVVVLCCTTTNLQNLFLLCLFKLLNYMAIQNEITSVLYTSCRNIMMGFNKDKPHINVPRWLDATKREKK